MKHLTAIGVLLVVALSARSQSDLQNTGILYISGSSDIVYVNAGFTNSSTAALTNNGALHVSQTLSNAQSAMAVGTGTLYLNGVTSQNVTGIQSFRTFNLVTNNTAGIVLNNNLVVDGVHTFTNGIISSSATPNYLVYSAGSSYSGDDDSRHVSGWVKKLGSTDFAFPVGNGTVKRAVNVINLSASSEFDVRHNMTTQNASNLESPLVTVDANEYWTVNAISGGTAQIFMNWNHAKVPFPNYAIPDIRAAFYTGGFWTNQGGTASGTTTSTGTITSNTMGSFGDFTFGSISAVLSVNFIKIRAEKGYSYNSIYWNTAEESDISHFEILRSGDGLNFVKIGSHVPFNTSGEHQYEFRDNQPLQTDAWYRIRNIDIDGKSKYSTIVKIGDLQNGDGMQIINNPASGRIYLSTGQAKNGQYAYELFNVSGALLQTGTLSVVSNSIVSIAIDNKVRTGVCVLKLVNSGQHSTYRVVIK